MEDKKNNPLKSFITILISLAFAAFFLWLALKDFDFKRFQNSMSQANYWWVAFAGVFGLLAYWFRAVRWNLLMEPMGYSISNSNALWSISFGYLMNLTIPRSGEVARATALYGVEKVPVDKSVGTIILERVVDLICMIAFLGLTLIFKFSSILSFWKYIEKEFSKKLNNALIYLYIFIAVSIFLVVVFILLRKKVNGSPIYKKIRGIIYGVVEGIKSIFKLKQKGKFIIYTIAIWVSYYFASYLVCFALPETSNFEFSDGFFILVVGTLGMIIPASGGIGAFNFAMKFGFMTLFIAMGKDGAAGGELGLTYSFITLPLQLFLMLIMGGISVVMLARERNRIVESSQN